MPESKPHETHPGDHPMGWISHPARAVTEKDVKTAADIMAKRFKACGWRHIVVDGGWYIEQDMRIIDKYGRYFPGFWRFPTSMNGMGFRPLADYVHGKGLRFGLRLLRGISRRAVLDKAPVEDASATADQIADLSSVCAWNDDNFGVDMTRPGAREYYRSAVRLLASWEVDLLLLDDALREPYHEAEIEAVAEAIAECGRPMALSLGRGEPPLDRAPHLQRNAMSWQIAEGTVEGWDALRDRFEPLARWVRHNAPDRYGDAGPIALDRPEDGAAESRWSRDELRTLLTLWLIARSPLLLRGDLEHLDSATASLLTNKEALAVATSTKGNRVLISRNDEVVWLAERTEGKGCYAALFNRSDAARPVAVDLKAAGIRGGFLGFGRKARVRDVWEHKDLGTHARAFEQAIPPHGAGLFLITE